MSPLKAKHEQEYREEKEWGKNYQPKVNGVKGAALPAGQRKVKSRAQAKPEFRV